MALDRVIERAFLQLQAGDFDAALETAERLISKRIADGYELKTQALLELGESDEAIAVAETAVDLWPEAWRLYNNLGTALLRAERHREALLAFRHAQTLDSAHNPELHLNLAIACLADEDHEGALEALAGNEEWGEFELPRMSIQLATLVILERWDDVLAYTGAYVDEMGEDLVELYGEGIAAGIYGARAMAFLHGKKQVRRAVNLAWDALRIYPRDDLALTTLREAEGRTSPFARVLALECEVVTPEEEEFISQYVVVADSEEDAMEYIAEYEANLSGGTPKLLASSDAGPEAEEFCGIVEVIDPDEEEEGEEY